jgi:hypothetical protein
MKNIKTLLIITALVVLASCGKNSSSSNPGSWLFKTNTFVAATCFEAAPGIIEADNELVANTSTYATLRCYFGGSNPTTGGTFKVVNYNAGVFQANHISFYQTINGVPGTSYISTGGNGNETVQVTVGSNGHISVSGSGLEMVSTGSDSSALTVNISQQQ